MLRLSQLDSLWLLILVVTLLIDVAILIRIRKKPYFRKVVYWSALVLYLQFVLTATVFSRGTIPERYDLLSFDVASAWRAGPGIYGFIDSIFELEMNVLMFVPLGALLVLLFDRRKLFVFGGCFLITLGVETLQLATRRGFFELADILLNMTGATLGYLLLRLTSILRLKEAAISNNFQEQKKEDNSDD